MTASKSLRLVFTSDGVVVRVVRELTTRESLRRSKNRPPVISGVINSTESESEQSERFHFFRFRLGLRRL